MSEHDIPPLDPHKGTWDEEALSRRRFLTTSFWTATGVTVLAVGGAGTRFLVGDSLEPKSQQWVNVGDLASLPPGQVHRAKYSIRTKDVWREVEAEGLLYAYSDDGVEYTVLDATCTHLACNVLWQEAAGQFACPCHGGFFTLEGEVISGPPPSPLRRLPTKVENDVLLALI